MWQKFVTSCFQSEEYFKNIYYQNFIVMSLITNEGGLNEKFDEKIIYLQTKQELYF